MTWDATRALVLWAALVLAVGCSGGSSAAPEDAPPASTYRDANKELGIDVASATRAKEEARPEPREVMEPKDRVRTITRRMRMSRMLSFPRRRTSRTNKYN